MKISIFWHQLIDETKASDPKENHFGLINIYNNPKSVVDAFIKFTS